MFATRYDLIPHGGYGAMDDYAPFPPLPHGAHGSHAPLAPHPPLSDYGLRNSQNPSRQDYCSDSYASVHKPKKRMDQHIGDLSFSHICLLYLLINLDIALFLSLEI